MDIQKDKIEIDDWIANQDFEIKEELNENIWENCKLIGNAKLVHLCKLCNISFSEELYKRHMKTVHENLKLQCNYCNQTFTSLLELKYHEKTFHENLKIENLKLQCNYCNQTFKWLIDLKNHEKFFHKNNFSNVEAETEDPLKIVDDIKEEKIYDKLDKNIKCDIKEELCENESINESSEINDKINEYIKCEIKEELCENDSLIESPLMYVNLEKINNTPIPKHQCPIRIESRKYIDSNSKRVGRIKYECCGKIFDDIEDLITHMLIKHKNDKCKTCGKTFIQQNPQIMNGLQDLYFHKETPYTPFTCNHCEKCFSLFKTLKRHIKTVHKGVKRADSVKRHVEVVHKGMKAHVCNCCGKSFSQAKYLKKHVKEVHERVKDQVCNLCGKSFSRAGNLKQHIKFVHEGVKDHTCIHCGKSFSEKGKLKRHIKAVHEGVKDHVCNQCGKSFSRAGHLKTHSKTIHKGIKGHV